MYAKVNGTKLYYDIDGAEKVIDGDKVRKQPIIFVVHGGPGGNHLGFKPHLNELTKKAQLVYIDQRGCGDSDKEDPETYTLRNNVEDLEALRRHLGLEKIWILGHSYGGMVAMSYALKYQKHLAGLLLIATSPSYAFLEKAKQFVEEKGNDEQKIYAQKLWDGNFKSEEELQEYYRVMSPLYSVSSRDKGSIKRPKIKRSYEALNKGFGGFMRTFDIVDQLKTITVPSLIIAGRHDWITPVSENRVIYENIPGSIFEIMENSSHSVFADENEKFISIVSQYLTNEIKI